MNKQFINGVLETLRDDERQICKQAAHIIGELAEEIERLDKAAKDKYEYHAELIDKWAGECEDKDDEIDSLQSLNDFQQQQISCMESDIDKMKCCQNCDNSRYTEQGTTCKDDDLECDDLSHWVLRR